MEISITRERPDTPDARMLIQELDALIAPLYAIDDRYGYSVDKLVAQNVTFFVMRLDDIPAGCGGIQFFDEGYSETQTHLRASPIPQPGARAKIGRTSGELFTRQLY